MGLAGATETVSEAASIARASTGGERVTNALFSSSAQHRRLLQVLLPQQQLL